MSKSDHDELLKFTIVMKNSIMFLLPFDKAKWRQSCYYSNGFWQFMSGKYLDMDYYEGLSGDMTMEEFMRLDIPREIKDWTTFSTMWVSFRSQEDLMVEKVRRKKKSKKQVIRDLSHPTYKISSLKALNFQVDKKKGYYAFSQKLPKLVLFQKVDINLVEWDKTQYNLRLFGVPERMKSCLNCNKGFYPHVLRCSSCDLIL